MKCALVTGGSRGIGRAVCLKMAAMGYYVLVNYKGNEEEAKKTLSQIKENGGDGELLRFDVSNRDEIKNILGNWIEKNPDNNIEVLVNNAGIKEDGLMIFMKDEQWDNVLKTNLDGFFFCNAFGAPLYAHKKIRQDHKYCFSLRLKRASRTNKLFCSKSRHYRRNKSIGTGSWSQRNYGKCGRAGLYQN